MIFMPLSALVKRLRRLKRQGSAPEGATENSGAESYGNRLFAGTLVAVQAGHKPIARCLLHVHYILVGVKTI
jgi:hypothetical protein